MVVGFTTTCVLSVPIATKVVSSNMVHGEVYLIQHYVIKFVSDLRQVGGFLWVFRFTPPIKLTAMIIEILFTCGVKHHQTNKQICYVLTHLIGFMPKYLVQAHWNNNHYGS